MSDDIIPDIPEREGEVIPPSGPATGTQVRVMNGNLGAIRVDVRRDLARVRGQIRDLAAYFGEQFEYKLPYKRKLKDASGRQMFENGRPVTKTEIVRGPSIRCTTAVARSYGNCNVEAQLDSENVGAYLFTGIFVDIETGFRLARPFRQRKDQNVGGMGGDVGRVEDILHQIGASKATRNVIRNALPDLCEWAVEQANASLLKVIQDPKQRPGIEERLKLRLEEAGIPLSRIETFYGTPLGQMSPKVLAQIIGMIRALADGMITAAEICPQGEQSPKPGDVVPETDQAEETESDDEQAKGEEQEAGTQAQEDAGAQEQQQVQEEPQSEGKVKRQRKAAKEEPEEAPKPQEQAQQSQAEPQQQGGSRPQMWQVFTASGQIARRLQADDEGYFLAFEDEHGRTHRDEQAQFIRANRRRAEDVASRHRMMAEFLEGKLAK